MKAENVGKVELPNNTKVYFDNGSGICGYGIILGIADNPLPIIGYKYIIEPLFEIPTNEYTCIPVFEMWIDERKTKLGNLGI